MKVLLLCLHVACQNRMRNLKEHDNVWLFLSFSLNALHDFGSCTVPNSGSRRAANSHVGTVTRLSRELVLLMFFFRFSSHSCSSCAVSSCTSGFIF